MIHISKETLAAAGKIKRLNIVNSISGIKPANLIGTISGKGQTNLAVFSSVFHLGSNPALLGMIVRPSGEVPRHTYENILETGYFTINHVPVSHVREAHHTSAKFDRSVSEFDACGFTPVWKEEFAAPYVGESPLQIGLRFEEEIPIRANGTILIISGIEHIYLPEDVLNENGYINLEVAGSAGISGLNTYYQLEKLASFAYARPGETPLEEL